jgi:hypothetical protein
LPRLYFAPRIVNEPDEEIQEPMFLFSGSSNQTSKETDKETDSDENVEQYKKSTAKKIKLQRITNWNLKIISGMSELKKVKECLLSNDLVKALRGQYEHSHGAPYPSLHMTVKFSKQMTRLSVRKMVTAFVEDTTDLQINLTSLSNPEEIKASLKLMTNLNIRLENTESFSKGKDFSYTGSSKKSTLEKAKELILEKGKAQAGEEWAAQELPPHLFKKAKKDFEWAEAYRRQKDRRLAAEKQVISFYPWQLFLLEQLKQVPDKRTIWLVLDKNGCNGKTFFQIVLQDLRVDDVLLIPVSNTNNMLHSASKHKDYKIVFMNVARQFTNINLAAVEIIKDGHVSSGKYQGQTYRTDPPHVVLFSNKPLYWKGLTEDRWKILHITAELGCASQDDAYEILTLSEYLSAQKKLIGSSEADKNQRL